MNEVSQLYTLQRKRDGITWTMGASAPGQPNVTFKLTLADAQDVATAMAHWDDGGPWTPVPYDGEGS
ncbi:MAG: hypothetical protein F4059_09695 [Gemmatimonadetes bacterium]|nr:hypothetical protein [Gemmatimonadota bacterium]